MSVIPFDKITNVTTKLQIVLALMKVYSSHSWSKECWLSVKLQNTKKYVAKIIWHAYTCNSHLSI